MAKEPASEHMDRAALLQSYLENAPHAVFVTDESGGIVEVNPVACHITGCSASRLCSMRIWDLLTPASRETGLQAFDALSTGDRRELELAFQPQGGPPRWWSVSMVRIAPECYLAFCLDLTERHHAEEAFRRSEQYNRSIIEVIPDIIMRIKKDGEFLDVLAATEDRLALPREALLNRKVADVLPAEVATRIMASLQEAFRTRTLQSVEYELQVPAGNRWFEARILPSDEAHATAFIRDVTERRQEDERRRFQIEFQQAAAEASAAFVGVTSDEEFDTAVNRTLRRLGELFEVDRGYLFRLSPDRQRMSNSHEWCARGVTSQKAQLQDQPVAAFPWWKREVLERRAVHIPDVEALPAEAEAEKFEFTSHGIRSLLCLPTVSAQGVLTGFLGFDAVNRRYCWPQEQIVGLQIVADTIGGALERRDAEKTVVDYEALLLSVSRVAAQFVASTDWSSTLRSTLPTLGQAARADRVYYFTIDSGSGAATLASQTHEWCTAGIEAQIDNPDLQGIALGEAGYARWEALLRQRALVAGNVGDFPESEREVLEAQGIRSLVVSPVFAGAEWVGFLGFDECSGRRTWSVADREVLRLVADAVGAAIERQAIEASLAEARHLEVDIGSRIQRTLLNGVVPPDLRCVDVGVVNTPSQRIDGDFFDVFPHSDMVVDVVLGDVMGKGVPAALVSAATKSQLLRAFGLAPAERESRILEPAAVVSLLHRGLAEQLVAIDSFVTMSFCRFDVTRQVVTMVDCGHTSAIQLHAGGGVSHLKGDNVPLGFSISERYEQHDFPFEEGDVVLLYSDGVTESRNHDGEEFGIERLAAVAGEVRHRPAAEIVGTIRQAVVLFSGADTFLDDFTCLAIAIPQGSRRRELCLESRLEDLGRARAFVRSTCAQKLTPPIPEDAVHLLMLAVDEALSNVVVHAYRRDSGHPIHLTIEVHAEHVFVELRHRGHPFDPEAIACPSFDGSRDGGFGLHLIRQSVDEMAQVLEPDGTTRIRLRKRTVAR